MSAMKLGVFPLGVLPCHKSRFVVAVCLIGLQDKQTEGMPMAFNRGRINSAQEALSKSFINHYGSSLPIVWYIMSLMKDMFYTKQNVAFPF